MLFLTDLFGQLLFIIMADLSANENKTGEAAVADSNVPSEEAVLPGAKYHWYRGVFFQATIVGIAAFTAPGLWNAMQSVGAGGQQTPFLVMYVPSSLSKYGGYQYAISGY